MTSIEMTSRGKKPFAEYQIMDVRNPQFAVDLDPIVRTPEEMKEMEFPEIDEELGDLPF